MKREWWCLRCRPSLNDSRIKNCYGEKILWPTSTLDALRPLSNLIWGYIQDTEANHLLTTRRRAFEYDHQYGLSLFAGGGFKLNSADRPVNVYPGIS